MYSPVVTRASVVLEILSSIFMEANFLGFNGIYAFSSRRRFRRQRSVCYDFVNLENLLDSVSKILIRVELRACIYMQ